MANTSVDIRHKNVLLGEFGKLGVVEVYFINIGKLAERVKPSQVREDVAHRIAGFWNRSGGVGGATVDDLIYTILVREVLVDYLDAWTDVHGANQISRDRNIRGSRTNVFDPLDNFVGSRFDLHTVDGVGGSMTELFRGTERCLGTILLNKRIVDEVKRTKNSL